MASQAARSFASCGLFLRCYTRPMSTLFISIALALFASAPQDASSDTPLVTAEILPLPADQAVTLRCATVIAVVAAKQQAGDPEALAHPPLAERGQEYFVQTMAKLAEDTGLTRTGLRLHLVQEAGMLQARPELIDQSLPGCLDAMNASGI